MRLDGRRLALVAALALVYALCYSAIKAGLAFGLALIGVGVAASTPEGQTPGAGVNDVLGGNSSR